MITLYKIQYWILLFESLIKDILKLNFILVDKVINLLIIFFSQVSTPNEVLSLEDGMVTFFEARLVWGTKLTNCYNLIHLYQDIYFWKMRGRSLHAEFTMSNSLMFFYIYLV